MGSLDSKQVRSTILGAGTSVVAVDNVKQVTLKEGADPQWQGQKVAQKVHRKVHRVVLKSLR